MDFLDDDLFLEPAVTNARGVGKFQPKVKPRPKKIAPKSISSTLPNSEKEQPTLVPSYGPETAHSGQDVEGNKMRNLVGPLADASAISGTNEPFKDNETSFSDGTRILELVNSSSQVDVTREDTGLENAQCAKVAMLDNSHTLNSCILKSAGEVASMEYGLDPFDGISSEPVTKNARASVKFQPKVKPNPRKDLSASVASDIPNAAKEKFVKPTATVPNMPNDIFVSSSATSEIQGAEDDSGNFGMMNASSKPGAEDVTNFENTMPNSGACSTGEHADIFFGLEVLDDFLAQPSSGMVDATSKIHHETSNLTASNKDTLKDKSDIPDPVSVDPSAFTERGVTPDFDSRDTMPGASIASDHLTFEFQVNEEPINHAEISHIDDAVFEDTPESEDVPLKKMGAKSRKRKNSTVSDNSQKSKKPSSAGEKGGEKSLRQPRKGVACELIDEYDDEAHDNSEFHAETLSNSAVDVVEDGNEDCCVGSASKKKRAPRKKPVADSDKKVRKRNRANKETDQPTDQPPKKFSHSTRRTRRQVDKTLLETPEDELELTKLPIRDLIMLYLHKERMENKEAKSKKPESTNQSADNDTFHNEEGTFGTENNGDFYDNQGAEAVQMTSPFFNYHSYMDKTRSAKWSKQDDELFYKCVQQFGIDLSMIQLVFPDRTRRQIKLKLKKEERQHPLRLTEAVQNRAKDHSQFESIIEQLKQAGGMAEEECDGSESVGVTGEEDREEALAPENNDEVKKGGQDEEAAGGNDPEAEAEDTTTMKVDSPLADEFDEIEDDFDINDYRSEY